MTRTYTPDEEAWLAEHYPTLHPAELIAEHDGMFPDSPRTYKALLTRAERLGIRKAEGYRRNPPKMWTDEKVAWFRSFVPGHSESEISAEHERLYGFPLTEGQIGNAKTKFGVKSGTHGGQFEKGSAGGFRDEGHRRAFLEAGKATRFRKGEVRGAALARKQPVGSERVNKDGYVEVKVSEGLQERPNSNFRLKHHLAYEQAYGSILEAVTWSSRTATSLTSTRRTSWRCRVACGRSSPTRDGRTTTAIALRRA